MESLIRQIARTIEEGQGTGPAEPLAKALKEMVFSGLSRGGFFRKCVYLPEPETGSGRDLYTCFLYTGTEDGFRVNDYFGAVQDELQALGSSAVLRETGQGFAAETVPGPDEEAVRLFICVFQKKLKETAAAISYVHGPLPYELRSAEKLPASVLADIQGRLKAIAKAESPVKKKVPKKARSEKKRPEEPKETWVQPSLFDF